MTGPKKERGYNRIFFATDLHASEIVFRKFLSAAKFYDADALIMGGDVFGKTFVPIVRNERGTYGFEFNGQSFERISEEEIDSHETKMANAGDYSRRYSEKEYEEFASDPMKVEAIFEDLMVERMGHWAKLAWENLQGTGVRCYWTGGNDDKQELLDKVVANEYFVPVEGKVVMLDGGHELASLGWSNPTPWHTPRECSEEDLALKLERLEKSVREPRTSVLNIHPPPFDSTLDMAGKLDENVSPPRPITSGGHQVLVPVGSTSVRKTIERLQPALTLCGHIHETRNAVKIGRTTCINPGSEYGSGYLRGVIVNMKDGGVMSYQFTSG